MAIINRNPLLSHSSGHVLVLIAVALVGGIAISPLFGADDPPPREPEVLQKERESHRREVELALQPLTKKYVNRLKAAQKSLSRQGDVEGALAVKREIDFFAAQTDSGRVPSLEGKWIIQYENGTQRTYIIRPNGRVLMAEEKLEGRISKNGGDVVLDFGDGKLERLSVKSVLTVEHFNPKSGYPTSKPVVGTGKKEP